MQPPHLLLFLFLPILLPGMWADPEAEPQVIQYLLTSLFANISSAEVSCVALVGDIAIFTLDPADWSIHFHWPWVSQAAAEDDGEKMMSQYKIALRNMIRFVHDTVQQTKQHYPLVVQFRAGCVLYPNTTSQGFLNVGWDGRDLVAFEVDKQGWEAQQSSQMAELVSKSLNRQKSLRILLEHLLSIWVCQSNFLTLKRYGKEILERQELPVATVFARTPSLDQLLLVCHVTGFYPRPISVAWLRDGQEVPPGPALNTSTILPNADLTYQLRSVLAVAPRDGHSYVCRVRHHSLGTRSLLIPWENHSAAPTISITIAVLVLVATAFAGGFWWWKCRNGLLQCGLPSGSQVLPGSCSSTVSP
ncbi:antigen-presenting glycoprotein CD1d isoform X1 [Zonotrichia albicollis]|uniref:antigen-presenting glycoprotein CD1d isoform X1 n=1 Tax=Zonotrichia albicollis TaxID=44394 RepID=UPI003D81161D